MLECAHLLPYYLGIIHDITKQLIPFIVRIGADGCQHLRHIAHPVLPLLWCNFNLLQVKYVLGHNYAPLLGHVDAGSQNFWLKNFAGRVNVAPLSFVVVPADPQARTKVALRAPLRPVASGTRTWHRRSLLWRNWYGCTELRNGLLWCRQHHGRRQCRRCRWHSVDRTSTCHGRLH